MRDQRPWFHITPESGWLNDPNGLSKVDDVWHLFHQSSPVAPAWGPPEWAHLTSRDLLHWRREPAALRPLGVGPDGGGIWSGCVVLVGDRPSALYTGVEELAGGSWTQTVCLAQSDRKMLDWRRFPGNPVVAAPPHDNSVGFRDPSVFRDGASWAMLVGTGIDGRGGAIALYRGGDLENWRFEGYILDADCVGPGAIVTGRMWECPQLARSNETDILVWSVWDDRAPMGVRLMPELQYPVVAAGRFDGRRYRVDRIERFDHGSDCYAPAFLVDDGRILSWAWSWESLTESGRLTLGWAGALTYPREIWATSDGHVRQKPATELSALRGVPWSCGPAAPGTDGILSNISGDHVEILVRALPGSGRISLEILADPGGRERTTIFYDPATRRLVLDRSAASLWTEAIGGEDGGELVLQRGEPLELTVLVDGSIIEVFANDRLVITERVYPTLTASSGIRLSAPAGTRLDEFTVWPLRWPPDA